MPKLEGQRFAGAVARLLRKHGVTGGARLRIAGAQGGDPPMLVQVNLSIGGPARIQVPTSGPGDALPVVTRVEESLTRRGSSWRPRPWPDPARPALEVAAPGRLARRKTVVPARCGPAAAAQVMDAMDYDAHLFVDAETGQDAVVYRAGPSGVRLARQRELRPPCGGFGADIPPIILTPRCAPVLAESEAMSRVAEYGLPFLFYTDASRGRGQLLYRRYDADLTLLTPR
ncbi:sigma 54 modulation/S30EA ribosomal C-terminal domain-containing protein [Nocardia sp. MW-W600-9]